MKAVLIPLLIFIVAGAIFLTIIPFRLLIPTELFMILVLLFGAELRRLRK